MRIADFSTPMQTMRASTLQKKKRKTTTGKITARKTAEKSKVMDVEEWPLKAMRVVAVDAKNANIEEIEVEKDQENYESEKSRKSNYDQHKFEENKKEELQS